MKTILSASAAVMLAPSGAFAFAHLWDIQEVFSNADGSVQFIEFFENTGGGEIFLSSASPLSFQINGVTVNSMPFSNATATDGTADLPSMSTLNKTFLVATANFQGLYGFAPDYIIPANFIQLTGANRTLEFPSGPDEISLTLLPVNGIMSLNGIPGNDTQSATSINSQASPKNFAGQTVNIPEPGSLSTLVLGGAALAGLAFMRRRRS